MDSQPPRLHIVPPTVRPARRRRRHLALWASLVLIVVLPLAVAAAYLYLRAQDQYASTVGFSVRTEEVSSPIELFGGLAEFSGGSSSSDTDILYEYVMSQELVALLDDRLDLRTIYAGQPSDPVFSFDPGGSIEDLHAYWQRMARVDYDPGTGLMELRVLAFAPEDARRLAETVFEESARLINEITAIARDDNIRYAQDELDTAVERLKTAREALTAFRARSQIADPTADIQGQMGVLTSLQQQLAEALIAHDILTENTQAGDPRIPVAEQRIRVIEARIAEERKKFGDESAESADYATLIADYERLSVDREFAEEAYTSALAAYYAALAESRRQSRYLAAHIRPTLAETAEYPRREVMLALLGGGLVLIWSLMALVYYSIRDRR